MKRWWCGVPGGCPLALATAAMLFVLAGAATGAPAGGEPSRVDLSAFDTARHSVALPNGVTLAYVEAGNPGGHPVILVHGFTDSARDWAPMLPYLNHEDRLILVDIRGHGQSSKPECCYDRLDFAYDVKLLMDALGIIKADIVGHSLGSMICQSLAEEWPERVDRVVLVASSGGARPGAVRRKPKFDYEAEIRKLQEPLDPDSPFMIAWWDSPTPVDPEFIRRARVDAAQIPLRIWLSIADQDSLNRDVQRPLARLKAPTLLLWGSNDPIIDEEHRQTLREALPGAQVKVFAGLGHNPFWEDPRGVAAVINRFLHPAAGS